MYTSQKSIENKVGDEIKGWKDLLISVGFRFEPATNGIPPSVFFPQNDPGERLTQCSASLQALLGLTHISWIALSKLLSSPEAADEIIALFRQVVVLLTSTQESGDLSSSIQVPVNVKLWRVPGCHELLASLGFDLTEVGKEDVTLKMGKTAHRRQIQFALQALLALFDTQDAPRSLDVDEEESEVMEDDLEEDEQDGQDGYSEDEKMSAPYPAPRRLGLRAVDNQGHSSAFTCYVRKRGEPDGRQAGNGDSPTQPGSLLSSTVLPPSISQNSLILSPPMSMYQNQHIKGHESDCNFTPSPVDTLQRSILFGSPVSGHYHPQTHQHHHNHGAARFQPGSPNRKGGFRNTPGVSPLSAGRPDSSSSASSFNEWDHHQHPTLALRQTFGLRRPAGHTHFPSVQQKINQALGELSAIGSSFKQPLYENSGHAAEYTTRQPAGRPVVPIRSVFTDVGYQASLKITDRSDPNDKFSVRTEFGKALLASQANSTSSMSVGSTTSSNGSGNRRRNSDIQLSPAAEARLDPGVVKRVPPTGESGSPESTLNNKEIEKTKPVVIPPIRNIGFQKMAERSIDLPDSSAATSTPLKQQVKRETPVISEVYHERNLGLGLAPPLSKLILSNNLQVVQVDHHSDSDSNDKPAPISLPSLVPIPGPSIASMGPSSYIGANLIIENEDEAESFGNFDNLTAIEDAHQRNSFASSAHTVIAAVAPAPDKPKLRPPVPPKPAVEANWYMNTSDSSLSPTGATGGSVHIHPPHHHHPHSHNGFNFHQRDEGDGRSMSDSQYSGCSPSGQPNSRLSAHKSAKSVASQLSYMKLGEYINDQEITVLEEKEVVPKKLAPSFSPVVIEGPEYMNTSSVTFKLAEAGKRKQLKTDVVAVIKADDVSADRPLQPANHPTGDIKHPQLWSRDRHGGLTYTGRFASDC
jgi:hypothetical protein